MANKQLICWSCLSLTESSFWFTFGETWNHHVQNVGFKASQTITAGRQGSRWTRSGFHQFTVFAPDVHIVLCPQLPSMHKPLSPSSSTLFSSLNQLGTTWKECKDNEINLMSQYWKTKSEYYVWILCFMTLRDLNHKSLGRVQKVDFLKMFTDNIRALTRKALFWENDQFRASASSVNMEQFSHGWKNQMKVGFKNLKRLVSHISSFFQHFLLQIQNVPILAVDVQVDSLEFKIAMYNVGYHVMVKCVKCMEEIRLYCLFCGHLPSIFCHHLHHR